MKYSVATYEKAARELERRRGYALRIQKEHRQEAFAKLPELAELDQEIASAGIAVLKAIGMGENAKGYIETLAEHNLAAQERRAFLLRQAGYAANYLEPAYTCPLCADKGFYGGKCCDCHSKLLRSLAFTQLSEYSPMDSSAFSAFSLEYYPTVPIGETNLSPREVMERIFNFCRDYAAEFDLSAPSLLFHGETGLGKTHLSLAIAGEVIQNGFGVVYGSAQNLLTKLEKERFSYQKEHFGETEQTLLDCDLLILDDLGAEFTTQFTVACIYNIINTRLNKRLPVIISTNLSPEELEQKYSRRVTSRIIASYVSLQVFGNDIRQLKHNE